MKSWTVLALLLGAAAITAFIQDPTSAAARDYDCADFANQAEAEGYLSSGDPYNLDADSDGIACEDLPCPCSYSSGDEGGGGGNVNPAPPPKPAYHLRMRTAGRISKSLIAGVVNRSPRLESYSVTVCKRLGERSIDCRLAAKGETESQRTACQYRVAVRAPNRHPVGRIVRHRCRTANLPYLTERRAAEAVKNFTRQKAGPGAKTAPPVLRRISRLEFEARQGWVKEQPTPLAAEFCELEMAVRLSPASDELSIEGGEPTCKVA